MAEKKEYPRKMPLAPVDDATPPPKKAPQSPNKVPRGRLTSDALERRYDKQREKDLLVMPQKPTGYSSSMNSGGKVKKMASGGSASKRADGCATKGKTRGKMV
jgi:hypothetical protein